MTEFSEINIDWKSKVSDPEYAIAFIETLKGHIAEHLEELAATDARIAALEAGLQQIDDIADLTLIRGDHQYGLGQIKGLVATLLEGKDNA